MPKRMLFLFILIYSLMAACLADSDDAPPEAGGPVIADPLPAGETASVAFVIDGDTIEVTVNGRSHRVRYIGVDSPERGEPFYDEATQANRRLAAGQNVILVKDVSEVDQYGRLLRYVYLIDGTFVNAELLRLGYAQLFTVPPDVAEQEQFLRWQQQARAAGRGLWSQAGVDPDAPLGCVTCDRNAYDCVHFLNQAAAQACYDYCLALTGQDIHHLDGGGDGFACESLP